MTVDLERLTDDIKKYCLAITWIRIDENEIVYRTGSKTDILSGNYDVENKVFYLKVRRDAFPFGSLIDERRLSIPKEARKVELILIGEPVSELSGEQRLEHFFPKLRSNREQD